MIIAALLLCLTSWGCTRPEACLRSLTGTLTNGSPDPKIPLSAAQESAIGALRTPAGELVCTGTLIADGWVLTAAHCAAGSPNEALVFRTTVAGTIVSLPVVRRFAHPELDAMLLELPPSDSLRSPEVAALRRGDGVTAAAQLGATLTLVGFGETEVHTRGTRRYLQEEVVAVETTMLVVDGGLEHGACNGDSGGPLLAMVGPEDIELLGLLSGGNASCRGLDRYLRADLLDDWISSVQAQRAASPCGDIYWEGSCSSGRAEWCNGDHLEAEDCATGRGCGWDTQASGYRCVEEAADPCRGINATGSCSGDSLVVCSHGQLVNTDCAACGARCAWGTTGAECL